MTEIDRHRHFRGIFFNFKNEIFCFYIQLQNVFLKSR